MNARALLLLLAAATLAPAQEAHPTGIGKIGPVEKVASGMGFTEGPAADHAGVVYFSDLRSSRIYRLDPKDGAQVFLENTKRCNGLMVDHQGQIIACASGANRKPPASILRIDPNVKGVGAWIETYEGKPFNRLNDLVLDRNGGVYFTDITAEPGMPQPTAAVYYASADGAVTRLIDDLQRPNGVLLSPDEKTLYVVPAGDSKVMAYPVSAPGKVGESRVFVTFPDPPAAQPKKGGKKRKKKKKAGGDGLTVDRRGNVYLAAPRHSYVWIVDAKGESLGTIPFPEGPSNCCFGGPDYQTLYVTARTSVYRVKLQVKGHRFDPPKGD